MRLLLDTHLLVWALATPSRLDAATRTLIEDPTTEVLFSAASIWDGHSPDARCGRGQGAPVWACAAIQFAR